MRQLTRTLTLYHIYMYEYHDFGGDTGEVEALEEEIERLGEEEYDGQL